MKDAPKRVAIPVVVADEVLLCARLVVDLHLERLIDGREKVVCKVGQECDECLEVLSDFVRRETAHEVEGGGEGVIGCEGVGVSGEGVRGGGGRGTDSSWWYLWWCWCSWWGVSDV